ncbi:MAG: hypothetical protein JJ974_09065 [Phycisphaerales bacterium]|nr:hypothetical protein [Phycisphaerales bacterium]
MSIPSSTTESSSAFHDRLNLAVGDTSYRQLGTLTDTHPETVRRYMQGQAPSAAFMTNLCRSLGISGEWLLSGQGPMKVRDMRTHALKHADANELMGAIANTLTQLIERVDRLERFVQGIETRLHASGMIELKAGSGTMDSVDHDSDDGSADGRAETGAGTGSGVDGGDGSAGRIGGAVSKRSSEHDA